MEATVKHAVNLEVQEKAGAYDKERWELELLFPVFEHNIRLYLLEIYKGSKEVEAQQKGECTAG